MCITSSIKVQKCLLCCLDLEGIQQSFCVGRRQPSWPGHLLCPSSASQTTRLNLIRNVSWKGKTGSIHVSKSTVVKSMYYKFPHSDQLRLCPYPFVMVLTYLGPIAFHILFGSLPSRSVDYNCCLSLSKPWSSYIGLLAD